MLRSTDRLYQKFLDYGYDAIAPSHMRYSCIKANGYFSKILRTTLSRTIGNITVEKYDYGKIIRYFYINSDSRENVYPQLVPRWDKTPRRGKDAEVFYNTTPENFGKSIDMALDHIKIKMMSIKSYFYLLGMSGAKVHIWNRTSNMVEDIWKF